MIFSALINNVTLIIAMSILYSFIIRRWEHGSRTGRAISGVLFGTVAVVGMMNPLIISPGLIFDGRSIIISIAGFVGGWLTACIAAPMAAIYRIWLGGPGAIMGVSVIASSAAIGIAYHYIHRRSSHVVTPLYLIGFGIIVHVCMLAMTMTLPTGMKYEVLSNIAVPVMLIYPLGTLLVCVVLLDMESRVRAEEALRESEVRYRELFENASEAIFVAQGGKLVFHNPRTAGLPVLWRCGRFRDRIKPADAPIGRDPVVLRAVGRQTLRADCLGPPVYSIPCPLPERPRFARTPRFAGCCAVGSATAKPCGRSALLRQGGPPTACHLLRRRQAAAGDHFLSSSGRHLRDAPPRRSP